MSVNRELVTIGGIAFNADLSKMVDVMDGWEGSPAVLATVAANGGGPGAYPGGPWWEREKAITLGGAWLADSTAARDAARDTLVGAVPLNTEVLVTRGGRAMFLRLYDAVDVDHVTPNGFRWTLPMIALDPFKYDPTPDSEVAGVFLGSIYYRTYSSNSRAYASNARSYVQLVPTGLPDAALITNSGNATSRRVKVTVAGPLSRGDWMVVNDSTGQAMWADTDVAAGVSLVLDTAAGLATIGGSDVGPLVYGDWLTLAPGGNTFRLYTSTATSAAITVEGYSAWR